MRLGKLRHCLASIKLFQQLAIFLFGPRLASVRGRSGSTTSSFGPGVCLQRADGKVQRSDYITVLKN